MIVWKYQTADNYDVIDLTNFDADKKFYDEFHDGMNKPIPKMEIVGDKDSKKGDSPYLSPGIIVFSERMVAAFKDLLKGKVNFLPIECNGNDKYYIVQVTNVIDCLDYEKSVIKYYRNDPSRILGIDKYVFKPEMIAKQIIFIIPESIALVFVLEEFIERCETAGLVGMGFNRVSIGGTAT